MLVPLLVSLHRCKVRDKYRRHRLIVVVGLIATLLVMHKIGIPLTNK